MNKLYLFFVALVVLFSQKLNAENSTITSSAGLITSFFNNEDGYLHDHFQYNTSNTSNSGYRNTTTDTSLVAIYSIDAYSGRESLNDVYDYYFSIGAWKDSGIYTKASRGRIRKVTLYWGSYNSSNNINISFSNTAFGINTHRMMDTDPSVVYFNTIAPQKSHDVTTINLEDSLLDVRYVSLFASKYVHLDSLDIAWDMDSNELSNKTYYSRAGMSEGNFGTICLPYTINSNSYFGCSLYKIVGFQFKDSNYENEEPESLVIEKVNANENLEAGIPFIYLAKDKCIDFGYDPTSEQIQNPLSENGLHGTFQNYDFGSDATEKNLYIINRSGELCKASSKSGVDAYRAYIQWDEVPCLSINQFDETSLSNKSIICLYTNGNNELTNLPSVNVDSSNTPRDLSGRRANSKYPIYILNSKKYIKTK